MWSDNVATVDLLGHEDLLQEILDLSLDRSLQPLTIGAFADWGAGKSTLLNLAGVALRERGALVVEFSPWLVEGYDDVKTCLLSAVVDAITANRDQSTDEWPDKSSGLLRNLREKINWLRMAKLGASVVGPIAGLPAAIEIPGSTAIIPFAAVAVDLMREPIELDDKSSRDEPTVATHVSRGFHSEFKELIESTEAIRPVVVLVDDLDRCLPDQVIETLEAIRLFLSTPGTAFVIAADERLVRDAVRHRYTAVSETEGDLPREYLEKLVHVAMRIPQLTSPETESYCNLLVAERLLGPDEFSSVLEAAQQIRRSGELQVSCNLGIVRDVLSAPLPAGLETEFGLIEQVIRPLAVGLKGNPRQIKRYLNTFNMRRRTAERRGITIDESVLAKLVVLEYVRDDRHRELNAWQRRGGGLSEELAQLEEAQDDLSTVQSDSQIGIWVADPWTRDWLAVEPKLSGIDMTPYFFLSRDRVFGDSASSHLPPDLQVLVADLESDTATVRESAVDKAKTFDTEHLLMLLEASSIRLKALPDKQPMMKSMIEIAASQPALIGLVVAALASIPYPKIPIDIPLLAGQHLASVDSTTATTDLLGGWENQSTSPRLSKAALQARKRIGVHGGNL